MTSNTNNRGCIDQRAAHRLALGTVQFGLPYGVANQGGKVHLAEAARIIRGAKKIGIKVLDTAIGYGESEEVLGTIGLAGYQIVTKLPALPIGCEAINRWVMDEVQGALTRLGTKKLYGLMLHHPQDLIDRRGAQLYKALTQLKQSGQVQKIGVSVYLPGEMDQLADLFDFDLVQVPFNILDRRFLESGCLKRLKNKNVEIHSRSAFLQGLLLMRINERPQYFQSWHMLWDEWEGWLSANNISALEACLAYVFSIPEIDKVVVGVNNFNQLEGIVSASNRKLNSQPHWPESVSDKLINPSRWILT